MEIDWGHAWHFSVIDGGWVLECCGVFTFEGLGIVDGSFSMVCF